jgi:hypothetical protein
MHNFGPIHTKTYSWHGQEHHDQLFLPQNRMSDKRIRESRQATSSLLDEQRIRHDVVTIDRDAFRRQQR